MREKLAELQRSIQSQKRTKKIMMIIGLFVVALLPSIMLISYSHYVNEANNLVIEGEAIVNDNDVTLKIFLQDRDANGVAIPDKYTRIYFIPQSEYSYNSAKSACTKGLAIDGFADNKFSITANRKGYCSVYFDALESSIIKGSPNATLRIFAEKTFEKGDYVEVGKVPNDNYKLNENLTSKTCSNVSLEGTTINIMASSDIACVVYVDLKTDPQNASDITLNIYKQNRDDNGNALQTYSKVYYIPKNEYSYNESKTVCSDGLSASFDGTNVNVNASNKGYCNVYFDAQATASQKGAANSSLRIFAEQTKGQKDYVEVGKVPNENYAINQTKTQETCDNVTLSGTTITVTASTDTVCKVYLDIK